MSLQACPAEVLLDVISLVHPDNYLSIALACKKLYIVTRDLLDKKHRFKRISIGLDPSGDETITSDVKILTVANETGLAEFGSPLGLIREIALERTKVIEICTRSLVVFELSYNHPDSRDPYSREWRLISRFIIETLQRFQIAYYDELLSDPWQWHEAIRAGNDDAALAFLLLLLPNLQYATIQWDSTHLNWVNAVVRASSRNPVLPYSNVLRYVRELIIDDPRCRLRQLISWISLPGMKDISVTFLQASARPSSLWNVSNSNLTHLCITDGELSRGNFWHLFTGLTRLKKLVYHCTVSCAEQRSWSCQGFFAAVRARLCNTLEHLEVGVGMVTLEHHFWGWCGPLVDLARLKQLTLDCNMLYRKCDDVIVLGSALLKRNENWKHCEPGPEKYGLSRLLPSSIEELTIRDQNSDRSWDEYLKLHKDFTRDFLAGEPSEIRQTYPNLKTIYNVVAMDERMQSNLESVGIEFYTRQYFWETD